MSAAPPDSGEREVRKHRCMRCGDEFDCTAPGCVALYDVLPMMIRGGVVMEHECARSKMSLIEALKKIASGCTTDPAATARDALDRWPRIWDDDPLAERILAALEKTWPLTDAESAELKALADELRKEMGK